MRNTKSWYGIVDGNYRHQAIMLFMEVSPMWFCLSWMFTSIRPGQLIVRYRQLARVQNSRTSQLFYVDFTFPDVLSNLRMKYDHLKLSRETLTAAMVLQAYGGNTRYATASLKKSAQTAMRVNQRVFETIKDVAYVEDAALCFKHPKFSKPGFQPANN